MERGLRARSRSRRLVWASLRSFALGRPFALVPAHPWSCGLVCDCVHPFALVWGDVGLPGLVSTSSRSLVLWPALVRPFALVPAHPWSCGLICECVHPFALVWGDVCSGLRLCARSHSFPPIRGRVGSFVTVCARSHSSGVMWAYLGSCQLPPAHLCSGLHSCTRSHSFLPICGRVGSPVTPCARSHSFPPIPAHPWSCGLACDSVRRFALVWGGVGLPGLDWAHVNFLLLICACVGSLVTPCARVGWAALVRAHWASDSVPMRPVSTIAYHQVVTNSSPCLYID